MQFFAIISLITVFPGTYCMNAETYSVQRNTNVKSETSTSSGAFLSSLNVRDRVTCLVQCNLNAACQSILYNTNSHECSLFKSHFTQSQQESSSDCDLYSKGVIQEETVVAAVTNSSVNVFQNFELKRTLADNIQNLCSFEMLGSKYYLADLNAGQVFIYNEDWQYLENVPFSKPAYMKAIGNEFYVSLDVDELVKTDQKLDINGNRHKITGSSYRGIYYEAASERIFVCDRSKSVIQIFDKNLKILKTIQTTGYSPFSIAGYQDKIYVGTSTGGFVLIIKNDTIDGTIRSACSNYIHSLYVDSYGYIALACHNSKTIYLYDPSFTLLNETIVTPKEPTDIKMDTRGRFVVLSYTEVYIYN